MIVVITTIVKRERAVRRLPSIFITNPSLKGGRRDSHPAGSPILELADHGFVPERQPYIVEPFEQTLTAELVDLEGGLEAVLVAHLAAFEVYGQTVALNLTRAPHEFRDLFILERDGEHAVLR